MKQAHVESFPGLVYASVYFTTDQYVPNLPQMEFDLQGSQTLMSGTVQLNIMVKGAGGVPWVNSCMDSARRCYNEMSNDE